MCLLEGDVYNEGFEQYFSNSSADHYFQAVDGLRELGAMQSLELLLQAKGVLFGSNRVPPTQAERTAVLPKLDTPGWSEQLDAIDRRFWEDADQIGKRLARFAEQHGLYPGA